MREAHSPSAKGCVQTHVEVLLAAAFELLLVESGVHARSNHGRDALELSGHAFDATPLRGGRPRHAKEKFHVFQYKD